MEKAFWLGTSVSRAWVERKANDLLDKAITSGGCLICHLMPNARGYCPVSFGRAVKARAHRVVFFACNPEVDQALLVLHKCDNRACINPKHLFAGTAQDNTDDMIAKGRKVDDPEIAARRRVGTAKFLHILYSKGYTDERIESEYGISKSTLWNYKRGPFRSALSVPSGD